MHCHPSNTPRKPDSTLHKSIFYTSTATSFIINIKQSRWHHSTTLSVAKEMIPTVDEIIEKEVHLIVMANGQIHCPPCAFMHLCPGGRTITSTVVGVLAQAMLEDQHLANKRSCPSQRLRRVRLCGPGRRSSTTEISPIREPGRLLRQ